jgi:hypothetical protein
VTEDELWDRIEAAIQDIVYIMREVPMTMFNKDIAEKVQRGLPAGEWVSTETIERMLEHYWSVDVDAVEPTDEA